MVSLSSFLITSSEVEGVDDESQEASEELSRLDLRRDIWVVVSFFLSCSAFAMALSLLRRLSVSLRL